MSKTEDDSARLEVVEVRIFDQTYKLRSRADVEHVRRVAAIVDERLRILSSQMSNHDLYKVAVLTALNIADEMEALRSRYQAEIEPLIAEYSEEQGEEGPEPGKPETWFEDFFEAKVETKAQDERLSSRLTAKLKSLKQNSPGQLGITTEEPDA